MNRKRPATKAGDPQRFAAQDALEVLLIVVLFFVQAGSLPPEVNEAHYLVKARHFWDPSFCAGDIFCESSDAHWAFYFTLGWLTRFMSLPAAAWTGRVICWTLLAFGWQRLCAAVAPGRWLAWISAGVAVVLWQHGHLGGEWVVGGVEAKSLAYGFVFLSLAAWAKQNWLGSLIFAGIAGGLHVLVGGWAVIALGIGWLLAGKDRPALKSILPGLVAAFVLSAPGWLPAISLSYGVDSATVAEANSIYTYERLSHHLVFHRFDHLFMLRHAALAIALGWLWWKAPTSSPLRRLLAICLGAIAIAVIGILIDQVLLYRRDIAAGLLRFYFFRLSDALVPLGIALAFAAWLQKEQDEQHKPTWKASLAGGAALLLVVLHLGHVSWQRHLEQLPPAVLQTMPREGSQAVRLWGPEAFWQTDDVPPPDAEQHTPTPSIAAKHFATIEQRAEWFRQWRSACDWIRENTKPTDRFLTPREQQTFKWYAQRPEVVSWKDVPQDAASLVKWHTTWEEIHPWINGLIGLGGHSDKKLRQLGRKHEAQYVLIDRTRSLRKIELKRVYPEFVDSGTLIEVFELEPQ